MKFSVYFMAMMASAFGTILSTYLITIINLPDLINAIFWFLIAFVTYIGARKIKDASWFKMLSIDFFLTWAFISVGVILGVLIMALFINGSLTIIQENLTSTFFKTLPLALGPAATTSMGLRE